MDFAKSTATADAAVLGALRRLEARAQDGDVSALKRIRSFLDDHPEVWKHLGDLSKLVQQGWLELMATSSPLVLESIVRTVAGMRQELLGDLPTRLEAMLVDDIIATWLETRCCESLQSEESSGLPVSIYRLKRMESASKRYHCAIKTLQEVRAKMPKEQPVQQPVKLTAVQPQTKLAMPAAKQAAVHAKKSKADAPRLRIYNGERKSA